MDFQPCSTYFPWFEPTEHLRGCGARVLPLPLLAMPMRSQPALRIGQHCAWMGVGATKCASRISFSTGSGKPAASHIYISYIYICDMMWSIYDPALQAPPPVGGKVGLLDGLNPFGGDHAAGGRDHIYTVDVVSYVIIHGIYCIIDIYIYICIYYSIKRTERGFALTLLHS